MGTSQPTDKGCWVVKCCVCKYLLGSPTDTDSGHTQAHSNPAHRCCWVVQCCVRQVCCHTLEAPQQLVAGHLIAISQPSQHQQNSSSSSCVTAAAVVYYSSSGSIQLRYLPPLPQGCCVYCLGHSTWFLAVHWRDLCVHGVGNSMPLGPI
jgi:hypothetical protein